MITGQVSEGYPSVAVTFRIPGQRDMSIEFVVDTGFAGYMTLPSAAVAAIRLPFFYEMPANLADDSNIMVDVYTATVLWYGAERDVEILRNGQTPADRQGTAFR